MAGKSLTLDEFRALAGTEVGVSDWIEVPQEKINAFAEVTGDHQFIHVNPELAAQTPFGTTIAHGYLTLSLLSVMAYQAMPGIKGTRMGVNYGQDPRPLHHRRCVAAPGWCLADHNQCLGRDRRRNQARARRRMDHFAICGLKPAELTQEGISHA